LLWTEWRTAATQTVFIEHVGIPTLAAVRQAVDALEDLDMRGKVQPLSLAVFAQGQMLLKRSQWVQMLYLGQGIPVALGCNSETYIQNGTHHSAVEDYTALSTAPATVTIPGSVLLGVTTQDEILENGLNPKSVPIASRITSN